MLISPTFFIRKVPLEVYHECGTVLSTVGMYLLDPFLMERRLLLDAVALELLYFKLLDIFNGLSESIMMLFRSIEMLFFELQPFIWLIYHFSKTSVP